jgi:UDP-glucose:(glucosyl)LPS alpha-1,2-glucosyltransferase
MSLNIIDDTETVNLGLEKDGTYTKSKGGTELMNEALHERVDNELLNKFHIIKSRVRESDDLNDDSKKNILWLHDTWNDPEAKHLEDEDNRKKFSKLVFVSNYQLSTYNMGLGVPYSESIVLKNAIDPIALSKNDKPSDQIRLIYHTTPHRGLNIVYAAVSKLAEMFGDKIHLDVYSSFEAYGWKERDKPFEGLFEDIRNHPNMTYHGFKSNAVVRRALIESHIFAYPSIWPETSCIAAIEAMSAGLEVICPNYAALPETTGGFARMYQWTENMDDHANIFVNQLYGAINQLIDKDDNLYRKLVIQKNWIDNFYNWDLRSAEWTYMLEDMLEEK